jgi:hypothetical protein
MKTALRSVRDLLGLRPILETFRFAASGLLFACVWAVALSPLLPGSARGDNTAMETTRQIALAMAQYAQDHGGKYPGGASSTEVFQKLLDGKYVTDPATFYLIMPGKTQPTGTRLLPQNVCYDVTSGVDANSPESLPVVFVTGFRVEYQPDGSAISLTRSFPVYAYSAESSMKWLTGSELEPVFGLAVADKGSEAKFRDGQLNRDGYGSVPNVLPADFDAHGAAYRQLTPSGAL